eukprot:4117-Chlamydomonas_euryale.AAC.1
MPGGEKMTGFTRILHRTVPDLLMDEAGGGAPRLPACACCRRCCGGEAVALVLWPSQQANS